MTAIENEQELFPEDNGQRHPAGDRGDVKGSINPPDFDGHSVVGVEKNDGANVLLRQE
jgi:hypothetical protein